MVEPSPVRARRPEPWRLRSEHADEETFHVCLAIPGQVVEVVDPANRIASVEVAGVRRKVNIGLLDGDGDGSGVGPGDWVLIHVGFAMSQVDEAEALETRRMLEALGADYEQELKDLRGSVIE